jgi:hypothetical protein
MIILLLILAASPLTAVLAASPLVLVVGTSFIIVSLTLPLATLATLAFLRFF